jgi:malate dehydrogenase (oxaloacetate-decarboxylating)
LYLPYPNRADLDAILRNSPTPNPDVIVVTDGERILGLGDLGIGGMGIPVGKLSLYTLCAGIDPTTTLPIVLDVGTNNQALLEDPLYLGWRHRRIDTDAYDDFVEAFVAAVMRRFPNALLQWEDFSKNNAGRLLARYRDRLCTFNDDIQGTGAVTLAGVLAAINVTGERLGDQRVVVLGAGSSAIGISDQLVAAMTSEGVPLETARRSIWLVDSEGLVHAGRTGLGPKATYAQPLSAIQRWKRPAGERLWLADVVRHVHPTILIGTSAQPGTFTEAIVREMAGAVRRPIIFPLSNPTSKSEAAPIDLIRWTEGRALVATGSPYAPVIHEGRSMRIGQCNNAFIFPGVGLGVIASGARRVTDEMFVAAARALSNWSPARQDPTDSLYPRLEVVRDVARDVAIAVAREAQRSGIAPPTTLDELTQRVKAKMWEPVYPRYRVAHSTAF